MIELKNVSVRFNEHEHVLSHVNLTIQKSESFVLVGPSGMGKSVLLKLLGGLLSPTEGQVLIEGKDLYAMPEKEKTNTMRRMGMLFQKNALFDSLSCADNIAFPLQEVTELSIEEIKAKVDYFLLAVGLSDARDLFPSEISGGMQKRLGIARALALDPEIILYDDPTAGLDPVTSRKIIELILDLQKKRGATLVAVTNEMNRAYQLADRIGLVVEQNIVFTGTPQEIKKCSDPRVHQFVSGSTEGPLTESSAT